MPPVAAKLVTIVAAFETEAPIQKKLAALKVHGYSVTNVTGRGRHGQQPGGFFEAKNVSFSIVTTEARARQILEWVDAELAPSYPCIAYATDVMAVPADLLR